MDVLMEMYEEEMKNPIQGMLFGKSCHIFEIPFYYAG